MITGCRWVDAVDIWWAEQGLGCVDPDDTATVDIRARVERQVQRILGEQNVATAKSFLSSVLHLVRRGDAETRKGGGGVRD